MNTPHAKTIAIYNLGYVYLKKDVKRTKSKQKNATYA